MPIHRYQCKGCKGICEVRFALYKQVTDTIDIEQCGCDECPGVAHRIFTPVVWSVKKVGKGWPDKDRKVDTHMKYVNEVMSEEVTNSEAKEGMDMLREREKERGYPEGYLTGERPTEMVEVAADTGQEIDRLDLAKKIDAKTGHREDINKIVRMTDEKVKRDIGKTVKVERTIKRGKDDLKKRATSQKQDRGVRHV